MHKILVELIGWRLEAKLLWRCHALVCGCGLGLTEIERGRNNEDAMLSLKGSWWGFVLRIAAKDELNADCDLWDGLCDGCFGEELSGGKKTGSLQPRVDTPLVLYG